MDIVICILIYDALHDFSVWLRIGSNPEDINRFESHTGKDIDVYILYLEKCMTKYY